MAARKVKNLWTAFTTALFALLAAVGLTTAATAAQRPVVPAPDEPSQARGQAALAIVPAQSTRPSTRWTPTARDRSLPPTIKQRIRAESHGSSPATRHLPAVDADSVADASLSSAASASAPIAYPALAAA